MKHLVRFAIAVDTPAVAEALVEALVEDAQLTDLFAHLDRGEIVLELTINAPTCLDALITAATAVRTAIHNTHQRGCLTHAQLHVHALLSHDPSA